MSTPITALCATLLLLYLSSASAHGSETDAANSVSLLGLIRQGGWTMYPLGACSLISFFLLFYGVRETEKKQFIPARLLPRLTSMFEARDIHEASTLLEGNTSALATALKGALLKVDPRQADANRTQVEATLAESLERKENAVGQWIHYLNVVAAVAPMIGLLGTVSGMISAFQTISDGGMGRPELFAGDIGQALVTTATGLVIGIPAMVAYFILQNRLNNQMLATAHQATLLIDTLTLAPPHEEEKEVKRQVREEVRGRVP